MQKKAVYFLCLNQNVARPVAGWVWDILSNEGLFSPAGFQFHGLDVMRHVDAGGNQFDFVPTDTPLCWDYPRYLPKMNEYFSDYDMAGMVTWHEGASAPERVLSVHSIGDVNSGIYGPANPGYMRNLLCAMEENRQALGLCEFQTVTEATHWSGTYASKADPALLCQFPVPMVDIEVGSVEESWKNATACRALALALPRVFDDDGRRVHNILCVGGVHFDPNFASAVFTNWANDAFGVSHILANQWLVSGEYELDHGLSFASAAVDAIPGGIEAIAFHDKMKGCYKDLVRTLGEKYNVPILRHQRLRNPGDTGLK